MTAPLLFFTPFPLGGIYIHYPLLLVSICFKQPPSNTPEKKKPFLLNSYYPHFRKLIEICSMGDQDLYYDQDLYSFPPHNLEYSFPCGGYFLPVAPWLTDDYYSKINLRYLQFKCFHLYSFKLGENKLFLFKTLRIATDFWAPNIKYAVSGLYTYMQQSWYLDLHITDEECILIAVK